MKAILVDDEENAQLILEIKLKKYFPQIEITGKYSDPSQAIEAINAVQPDLLFLDIKMPNYSGFELLNHVVDHSFELIFVTAYEEYAIEAIKQCAVGYILKPIDDAEFKSTVLTALNNVQSKTETSLRPASSKITIPFEKGFLVREVGGIVRCEGYEGYTKILFKDEEPVVSSYSIGFFGSLLTNHGFMMVHKSHLVNINCISAYYNSGTIELINKDMVPVSRLYKDRLIKALKP